MVQNRNGHAAHAGLAFLDLFGKALRADLKNGGEKGVCVGDRARGQLRHLHAGEALADLLVAAPGEQGLAQRGAVQRIAAAEGGLGGEVVEGIVFVDVGDALLPVVHDAEIDAFARRPGQASHHLVGDADQVRFLVEGAGTKAEELEGEAVFLRVPVLLGITEVHHGLQQTVGRGL